MGHENVRHGKKRAVHDAGRRGEKEDGDDRRKRRHGRRAQRVDQLTVNVESLSPEDFDKWLETRRINGAGDGIQRHGQGSHAHAGVVDGAAGVAIGRRGIAAVDSLTDEIGEIETVADKRHPTEEVGQAEDAQGGRQMDHAREVSGKREFFRWKGYGG